MPTTYLGLAQRGTPGTIHGYDLAGGGRDPALFSSVIYVGGTAYHPGDTMPGGFSSEDQQFFERQGHLFES